jgi:hypothetical protein
MKVMYNAVGPQLFDINDKVVQDDILEFGKVYDVWKENEYFYSILLDEALIKCGKSHFLTERELRKLKLKKIENGS